MPFGGMFGMTLWGVFSILAIVVYVLAATVIWAIWRMTWAHERIEKHSAGIERLLAARASEERP